MSNVFGKCTQGGRDYQEDFFSTIRQNEDDPTSEILIVLSDGMGGHAAGDVASKTAVRAFQASFLSSTSSSPQRRLQNALKVADQAIADRISEDNQLSGMGCTLIGALKLHNGVSWISVGDSHVFLFRDGRLRKLNADHSMMGELLKLVEKGQLTLEEARANPKKNALRSALVGKSIPLIDERSISLDEGDILIFATDGIDTLTIDQLQDVVTAHKSQSPEAMTQAILRSVDDAEKPNQDNTTVLTCYHTKSARPFWDENSKWTLNDKPRSLLSQPLVWAVAALAIVLFGAFLGFLMKPKPAASISPQAVSTEPTAAPQDNEISGGRKEIGTNEGATITPEITPGITPEIDPDTSMENDSVAEGTQPKQEDDGSAKPEFSLPQIEQPQISPDTSETGN